MKQAPGSESIGLILAGGAGLRMGRDKGTIAFHGRTLAEHGLRLLETLYANVFVSIRPEQRAVAPYCALPVMVDEPGIRGPAAALLTAWKRFPAAALMVLAVDMPLVDRELLLFLASRHNRAGIGTAFRNAEGIVEPLCAIWEPRAAAVLRQGASRVGPSLRRLLERPDAGILDCPSPEKLASANTPVDLAALDRGKNPR